MRHEAMPLEQRAKEALDRIKAGHGQMRIPAEATDPDMVIVELLAEVQRLQRELEAKRNVTLRRLVVFAAHKDKVATHWTRAGVALENRDGTITVKLDVLPLGGELHVRAPLGGEVA